MVVLALGGVVAGLLWLKLRIVSGLPRTAYATPELITPTPKPQADDNLAEAEAAKPRDGRDEGQAHERAKARTAAVGSDPDER
jgi:hypothetical protein